MACFGCCRRRPLKTTEEMKAPRKTGSYTNAFEPIASDPNLKLVQVQIVFRHGARTPINFVRGLEEAIYDASLDMDIPETVFRFELVKYTDGTLADESKLEPDLKNLKLKGGCRASILTTVGQRQTYDLGKLLREKYLTKLNLLRFSSETVGLRTSHLERTVKSLRCLLAGLFGAEQLNAVALRFSIDATLATLNNIPSMRHDRIAILKDLGRQPDECIDFACIRDDVTCRVVHGLEYPKILQPYRQKIEEHAAKTLHAVYSGRVGSHVRTDVTRLAIGRLLHHLVAVMDEFVTGLRYKKLHLYAAHDTTLAPMMEALGIWDGVWPPFSSSLIFELYKRLDDSKFYVRVLYCGEAKILRLQNRNLIPVEKFVEVLQPFLISPEQYPKTCSLQYFLPRDFIYNLY